MGSIQNKELLNRVMFRGDDLPCIPGPGYAAQPARLRHDDVHLGGPGCHVCPSAATGTWMSREFQGGSSKQNGPLWIMKDGVYLATNPKDASPGSIAGAKHRRTCE